MSVKDLDATGHAESPRRKLAIGSFPPSRQSPIFHPLLHVFGRFRLNNQPLARQRFQYFLEIARIHFPADADQLSLRTLLNRSFESCRHRTRKRPQQRHPILRLARFKPQMRDGLLHRQTNDRLKRNLLFLALLTAAFPTHDDRNLNHSPRKRRLRAVQFLTPPSAFLLAIDARHSRTVLNRCETSPP